MATLSNSTNIFWQDCQIGRPERQKLLNQKGCVVWITGLSGSGLCCFVNGLVLAIFHHCFQIFNSFLAWKTSYYCCLWCLCFSSCFSCSLNLGFLFNLTWSAGKYYLSHCMVVYQTCFQVHFLFLFIIHVSVLSKNIMFTHFNQLFPSQHETSFLLNLVSCLLVQSTVLIESKQSIYVSTEHL